MVFSASEMTHIFWSRVVGMLVIILGVITVFLLCLAIFGCGGSGKCGGDLLGRTKGEITFYPSLA